MSTTTAGARPRAWQGLVVPACITVALVAVLIGLGAWQVERLAWKTAILADIARAEQAAPVPLAGDPAPFRKVIAHGTLRPDLAVRYGADVRDTPRGTVMGSQLIVPLMRDDAPPLLVDLGWVPEGTTPALERDDRNRNRCKSESRDQTKSCGVVRASIGTHDAAAASDITGYARPGDRPGWFAAQDDLPGRQFFTLDPAAIGVALDLHPLPFVLVALGPPHDGIVPAEHLPQPPNNHLSYAITWFGLAGAMIGVFLAWARSKEPRP